MNRFEHIYQTKYIQISCLIMSMCSSGRRLFETWFLGDLTSNCLSFCGAWWGKMYSLWTSRVCVKPYSGVQHPAYCKRVLVGCCAVERALDIWIEPGAASTVLPNNTPQQKLHTNKSSTNQGNLVSHHFWAPSGCLPPFRVSPPSHAPVGRVPPSGPPWRLRLVGHKGSCGTHRGVETAWAS